MKLYIRRTIILSTVIVALVFNFNTLEAYASFGSISIDGYYDDWEDKPYSWEYNWDNPWQIHDYWDGTQNITKEYRDEHGNPYNLDIRHKMSLFSDGEYVYLYIKVSSNDGAGLYADDFQFWIDNEMTAFRITYPSGSSLVQHMDQIDPGIYQAEVRHGSSSISDSVVGGASAIFTKKPDNLNNEIEIKIPLSALKLQNNKINLDTMGTIEFFTPNMMYRRIANSGVSTGPTIGIMISAIFAGSLIFWTRYKNRSKAI